MDDDAVARGSDQFDDADVMRPARRRRVVIGIIDRFKISNNDEATLTEYASKDPFEIAPIDSMYDPRMRCADGLDLETETGAECFYYRFDSCAVTFQHNGLMRLVTIDMHERRRHGGCNHQYRQD